MAEPPIVVVGGGISGASVAYHLSERTDRAVVVYDRQSLASETTTKSAAFVGYYGGENGARLRMKREGIAEYNDLLGEPRTQVQTNLSGRVDVATTEAGAKRLRETAAELRAAAESNASLVEYYSGADVASTILAPEVDLDRVTGAIYRPNIVYTRPHEIAFEYVERATENGVTFQPNTAVEEILVDGGAVRGVVTEAETVETETVVCAAGPWSVELLRDVGIDLPVEHSLGSVLMLRPSTPLADTFPSLKHVESGLYFRQSHNETIFVGHRPDETAEVDPDRVGEKVSRELVATASTVVPELVPSLFDAELEEEWVGVRTMAADRDPIVGGTAVDGLFLTVYNGDGIMLAPAAGKLVADQIVDGVVPPYYEEVSLARFPGQTDTFR